MEPNGDDRATKIPKDTKPFDGPPKAARVGGERPCSVTLVSFVAFVANASPFASVAPLLRVNPFPP